MIPTSQEAKSVASEKGPPKAFGVYLSPSQKPDPILGCLLLMISLNRSPKGRSSGVRYIDFAPTGLVVHRNSDEGLWLRTGVSDVFEFGAPA